MKLSPHSAALLAVILLPGVSLAQDDDPILRLDADASLSFRSSPYWDEQRVDRLPPGGAPHTERVAESGEPGLSLGAVGHDFVEW